MFIYRKRLCSRIKVWLRTHTQNTAYWMVWGARTCLIVILENVSHARFPATIHETGSGAWSSRCPSGLHELGPLSTCEVTWVWRCVWDELRLPVFPKSFWCILLLWRRTVVQKWNNGYKFILFCSRPLFCKTQFRDRVKFDEKSESWL